MNIIDIYNKYHLPEHLQMQMLRVAACSNLIIDNCTGLEIDKGYGNKFDPSEYTLYLKYTNDEIRALTEFQERFFESSIIS